MFPAEPRGGRVMSAIFFYPSFYVVVKDGSSNLSFNVVVPQVPAWFNQLDRTEDTPMLFDFDVILLY